MAAVVAIGIISGSIAVFEALRGLFAGAGGGNTAVVRIGAGLNIPGPWPLGLGLADGDIDAVALYDNDQKFLGANEQDRYVGTGGFIDIRVTQTDTRQAFYAQIVAKDNAVCVAYVSITWVDGSQYTWVGDFGAYCGLESYLSNVAVGTNGHQPWCTWIDNDHTNSIRSGMIMINFPIFQSKTRGDNPLSYCGYPALRAYAYHGGAQILRREALDGDSFNTTGYQEIDLHARSTGDFPVPSNRTQDPRLLISSNPIHKATELCARPNSRGPHFVSLVEGLYCDMTTRQVTPLCTSEVIEGCFRLPAALRKRKVGSEEPVVVNGQSYDSVLRWD